MSKTKTYCNHHGYIPFVDGKCPECEWIRYHSISCHDIIFKLWPGDKVVATKDIIPRGNGLPVPVLEGTIGTVVFSFFADSYLKVDGWWGGGSFYRVEWPAPDRSWNYMTGDHPPGDLGYVLGSCETPKSRKTRHTNRA